MMLSTLTLTLTLNDGAEALTLKDGAEALTLNDGAEAMLWLQPRPPLQP
jgi:hypothetical protein